MLLKKLIPIVRPQRWVSRQLADSRTDFGNAKVWKTPYTKDKVPGNSFKNSGKKLWTNNTNA